MSNVNLFLKDKQTAALTVQTQITILHNFRLFPFSLHGRGSAHNRFDARFYLQNIKGFWEKLLKLVWGSDYPGDVRTVDVHVRRLREKIEVNPSDPKYVQTVCDRTAFKTGKNPNPQYNIGNNPNQHNEQKQTEFQAMYDLQKYRYPGNHGSDAGQCVHRQYHDEL